jgi:uncharacterized membrane protein YgcG
VTDEGAGPITLDQIGAQPLEPRDPRKIGAFPLHAVLGSGGMGRVYLGLAPTGYTAVKRVLPYLAADETFLRHFSQELDNQARLPTGVSARLLAADRTARPPWFATEYVPGVTLHEAVHLDGALPAPGLWLLLRELADRLRVVHGLSMMHRDLKPSNVMLTRSGATLIDFGVARAADQSAVTATGVAVGTPAYMAPEQARAERSLTPAVDVFSLGGVLTFAAGGRPPFGEGSGHDVFYRIVHQEPDLAAVEAVDRALAGLVRSCLAKDPADRPSAEELVGFAAANTLPGPVAWPRATTERIAVREAFAEKAPIHQFEGTEFEASWIGEVGEPSAPAPAGNAGAGAGRQAEAEAAGEADGTALPQESSGSNSVLSDAVSISERPRRATAKWLTLILPLLLVVGGTAGTLIAMGKVPWVTNASAGDNGDGVTTTTTPSASGASATSPATSAAPSTSTARTGSKAPAASIEASSGATTKTAGSGSGSGSSSGGSGGSGGGSEGGTATRSTTQAGAKPKTMAGFGAHYGSCFGACDPYPIVVSWNAQSDATSYDIHYQNSTSGANQVLHVTGTSYTIDTANSGDHVCLQMRADNQYGDSAWYPSSPWCFDMPY